MEIDISGLSIEEFKDLLALTTQLQDKEYLGFIGTESSFSNSGRKPLEIKKYNIFMELANGVIGANFDEMREFALKTPENIVYVLTEKSSEFEDYLFLPEAVSKQTPHIKKVSYGELD